MIQSDYGCAIDFLYSTIQCIKCVRKVWRAIAVRLIFTRGALAIIALVLSQQPNAQHLSYKDAGHTLCGPYFLEAWETRHPASTYMARVVTENQREGPSLRSLRLREVFGALAIDASWRLKMNWTGFPLISISALSFKPSLIALKRLW